MLYCDDATIHDDNNPADPCDHRRISTAAQGYIDDLPWNPKYTGMGPGGGHSARVLTPGPKPARLLPWPTIGPPLPNAPPPKPKASAVPPLSLSFDSVVLIRVRMRSQAINRIKSQWALIEVDRPHQAPIQTRDPACRRQASATDLRAVKLDEGDDEVLLRSSLFLVSGGQHFQARLTHGRRDTKWLWSGLGMLRLPPPLTYETRFLFKKRREITGQAAGRDLDLEYTQWLIAYAFEPDSTEGRGTRILSIRSLTRPVTRTLPAGVAKRTLA